MKYISLNGLDSSFEVNLIDFEVDISWKTLIRQV